MSLFATDCYTVGAGEVSTDGPEHPETHHTQRETSRAAGERVIAYLAEHAAARAEFDELGTPQPDLSAGTEHDRP